MCKTFTNTSEVGVNQKDKHGFKKLVENPDQVCLPNKNHGDVDKDPQDCRQDDHHACFLKPKPLGSVVLNEVKNEVDTRENDR